MKRHYRKSFFILLLSVTCIASAARMSVDNWTNSHLSTLKAANVFAVLWGGGDTTAPIQILSNPPANQWLISQIHNYEAKPTAIQSTARVTGFPGYITMGSITQKTPDVTDQLSKQKLDVTFHYEDNGSSSPGCYVDGTACPYTPEVAAVAAQAKAVTAKTGHRTIAAEVFYTMSFSDSPTAVTRDLGLQPGTEDYLTKHLYNLMIEAQLMEAQTKAGNQMMLLLNPNAGLPYTSCNVGTNPNQFCPLAWKAGIYKPHHGVLIKVANLTANVDSALDRMVTKGHLSSAQASAYKTQLVNLLKGGTSFPDVILVNNWIVKTFAPHVPFGWGIGPYDNATNPYLNIAPYKKTDPLPPWETASYPALNWLHKIQYPASWAGTKVPSFPGGNNIHSYLQYEATKLSRYIADMHMTGGQYAPNFIYFDKYERDPFPGYVGQGEAFNVGDWNTYLEYIKDVSVKLNNVPIALWQMPGGSLQTTPTSSPTGQLVSATMPDYVFGDKNLKPDLSNVASDLGLTTIEWTDAMSDSVYFTKYANPVPQNAIDYLRIYTHPSK